MPKLKKILKNNKKLIKLGILVLMLFAIFILFYKTFFYSSSEKSAYGVRLRNIKENEFTSKEQDEVVDKSSNISGISTVKINIKGRLIKIFINYDENVDQNQMKNTMNEILGYISDKVKGYYDITFYAKQNKDEKKTYPLIGYKHKNKTVISFDEL